ncbi:branched-chain amino acid ABC transporter permease [Bacterioplanes sanyensis]|uniref:urea ABC transporter permease subunit UrtB n=1 Tax=Bacterioplanes sanyensis TaxID=1249553 RepID=UPI001679EB81|nr:urea ABC transporter permease subunit UrtB [Bacterioplanes sanyensis]GGY49020.1 branched-chain amino acid ABC transporter permease [Bacterioplanes sanyensis]
MRIFVLFCLACCSWSAQAQLAEADLTLQRLAQQLAVASYDEKSALISQMAQLPAERKKPLLEALASNSLYSRESDQRLFVIERFKPGERIQAFFYDESLLIESRRQKRDFDKIGINNAIRRTLSSELALMEVSSGSDQQRRLAAEQLLKSPQDIDASRLQALIAQESSPAVAEVLGLVAALQQLTSADSSQRLAAIKTLQRSLYPQVRVALVQHQGRLDASNPLQAGEYQLVQKTLASIDQLQQLNGYARDLYFGLSLGAVLLLAAIGLAITFGVMGVINMAHGEMIMLGAYTTYLVQQLMPAGSEVSLLVAIPAAFLVSGLVGVVIERSVIRHLYGRPLETLLATFGISLILQQAVRSIFGPLNREVATPEWMAGTFMLNPGLELTWNRLYIIIFSLLVLVLLAWVMKRTLFGLQMRAVTMNRPMASSMGIRSGWVDALTFGLGSGIAGIAGVALSQLTNVGPNLGQAYIIDSFMVVVFGGVGNLWGTLVAAMSLGVANKVIEPFAGAVLAKILLLVFIILFIQKRPRGLFALKGRAVEG